jgi:hypothetical protein
MKAIFLDNKLGCLEEPDKGLAKTTGLDWKPKHPTQNRITNALKSK